jgi:photosystem II stability/assembly factor-like uncharacterized protein
MIIKFAPLLFLFVFSQVNAQQYHFEADKLPQDMSCRAVDAWNDQIFWVGGDQFRVAHTYDGGRTWKVDTLIPPGEYEQPLQYRAIELLDDSTVLVLSAGSPGVLWKTNDAGQHWRIVWQEDHPGMFMDAIAFNEQGFGWMFGDPFDGAFAIFRSIDRGENWNRIEPSLLPQAKDGEGGFAASDQLIAFNGPCTFIATSGENNRILRTRDQGESWDWVSSPISKKGPMAGPMAIGFKDEKTGFMVGGNWEKPNDNTQSMARTFDGGATWVNFMPSDNPGHRSSLAFLPGGNDEYNMIVAGRKGVDLFFNGTWTPVSELAYYTIIPIPGSSKYLLTGPGIWALLTWN